MRPLLLTGLLLSVGLAGCFGFTPGTGGFDYVPGQDWEPTGNTVSLKASVADWTFHEIFPGFHANLWAFCFEPKNPDDQYSADAIEYWNHLDTDGTNAPEFSSLDATCSVPGPTLRVKQGDLVRVEFGHEHFHPHTIHWHGQHLPWKMDGVPGVTQDSVVQGENIVYEFLAARAGTLWYHCHVDVQFHVMMGLFGMFIVEPQDDRWEPEDIDQEYNIVFSSLRREHVQITKQTILDPHKLHKHDGCGASGAQGCQNPAVDVEPDTWMMNGRSLPNTVEDEDTLIKVQEGDRVRLRILNAGETLETFHTHGHDMLVTHIDGNPLHPDARYYVDTLPIAPASRYDVVIDMNLPGLWVAHTHVDSHVTNSAQGVGGAFTMIAYESALEENNGQLRAFAAESFGGKPWILPLVIPGDVLRGDVTDLQATPGEARSVSETLEVPVALPCAVRAVRVAVSYEADFPFPVIEDPVNNEQTRVEDLKVTLTDAVGNVFAENVPLNDEGFVEIQVTPLASQDPDPTEGSDFVVAWKPGNATVTVAGDAASGRLTVDANVDYVEDEIDLALDSRILTGTGCDPDQRVFDPIAFAKEQGVL